MKKQEKTHLMDTVRSLGVTWGHSVLPANFEKPVSDDAFTRRKNKNKQRTTKK